MGWVKLGQKDGSQVCFQILLKNPYDFFLFTGAMAL